MGRDEELQFTRADAESIQHLSDKMTEHDEDIKEIKDGVKCLLSSVKKLVIQEEVRTRQRTLFWKAAGWVGGIATSSSVLGLIFHFFNLI